MLPMHVVCGVLALWRTSISHRRISLVSIMLVELGLIWVSRTGELKDACHIY